MIPPRVHRPHDKPNELMCASGDWGKVCAKRTLGSTMPGFSATSTTQPLLNPSTGAKPSHPGSEALWFPVCGANMGAAGTWNSNSRQTSTSGGIYDNTAILVSTRPAHNPQGDRGGRARSNQCALS